MSICNLREFRFLPKDIKVVKWHPSGELLVSGSYDNLIKAWREDEEEEWICSDTLDLHESTVWSLDFSGAGDLMASCSDDMTVKLWRIDKLGFSFLRSLSGYHERAIYSVNISRGGVIVTGELLVCD